MHSEEPLISANEALISDELKQNHTLFEMHHHSVNKLSRRDTRRLPPASATISVYQRFSLNYCGYGRSFPSTLSSVVFPLNAPNAVLTIATALPWAVSQ